MGSAPAVRVERYDGPHRDLERLFRLAEDSDRMLDAYIDRGVVLVARDGAEIVGHVQVAPGHDPGTWEVVNTAVVPGLRGRGIGRLLLEAAATEARSAGAVRLELATATADVGNLRYYQRCGFRMSRIVRDAFGPHTGYDEPIEIDGVPLRDQVWFDRDL